VFAYEDEYGNLRFGQPGIIAPQRGKADSAIELIDKRHARRAADGNISLAREPGDQLSATRYFETLAGRGRVP
jgi:hypothetical protein